MILEGESVPVFLRKPSATSGPLAFTSSGSAHGAKKGRYQRGKTRLYCAVIEG